MENITTNTMAKPIQFVMRIEEGYTEKEVLRALRMIKGVSSLQKMPTRRKKKAETITPDLMLRIAEAEKEMQQGECVTCRTHEELDAYLAAL